MMKKILLFAVLCVALIGVNTATAQTRWGVVAGADVTTLKFNQPMFSVDKSVGMTVGVVGELQMPGIGFGIDVSLLYTQRGATLHLGEKKIWSDNGFGTERSYLHYIELPINLTYRYTNLNGIENTIFPFVFAGPTFSFLVGHNKIDALSYAGGDMGVQVGLGAELFRKVQVRGSYCWGMTYALKTQKLDDFSAKSRTWKLTVAYMF